MGDGKEPKAVRFEVETDDGKVYKLTGDAAEEWVKKINDILILHQLRSGERLDLPDNEVEN